MSTVPADIAGIGSTAQKLRVSPGFDPMKSGVGPEEYFLLSRIDGTQTLRDVMLATGLPVDRAIAIVTRLRSIGALLLPGEGETLGRPATGQTATVAIRPPQPRVAPTPPGKPTIPARTTTPPPFRVPEPMPDPARATTRPLPNPNLPPEQKAATFKQPARAGTPPTATATPVQRPGTPPSSTSTPVQRPATQNPSPVPRTPTQPIPRQATPGSAVPTAIPKSPTQPIRMVQPPQPRTVAAAPVVKAKQEPLDTRLVNPSGDELAALSEHNDLSDVERRKVLAMGRLIATRDPYAILGVPQGADLKLLKHAYFKLSKEVHPDRFFGKELGSFAERLPDAFEAVSRAYARVTTPEKTPTQARTTTGSQAQTPQEYAAELFERACALEVGGDAMNAMKLFAAAVRLDANVRFLRRAANCALAANQPRSAVEYAKKAQAQAPDDPSCARLLAAAFRAVGKLADAEEVLVMAMALKSENDSLMGELRNDLAEVHRLLNG